VRLLLTSVYFDPNISLNSFKDEVKNLMEKLDYFYKVIISGDFNAKCCDFGDNKNNRKGIFLKRVLSSAGDRLENNKSATYKRNIDSVSESVLDSLYLLY